MVKELLRKIRQGKEIKKEELNQLSKEELMEVTLILQERSLIFYKLRDKIVKEN